MLIILLVQKIGQKRWNQVAEEIKERLPGIVRSGKQYRERWLNQLDPTIRKSVWDENEEFIFVEAHKIHGNKWAEIAKYIPGRTDTSIKNHYYSKLRTLMIRIDKDEIDQAIYKQD